MNFREELHEKVFNRQEFSKNLEGYSSVYIGKVAGLPASSFLKGAVEDALVEKVHALSANEILPNEDRDGILVAQCFVLKVMNTFENSNGSPKPEMPTDPEEARKKILEMAENFSIEYYDIPPTVTYDSMNQVDTDMENTRDANKLAAGIAKACFEHPYFAKLDETDRSGFVYNLDVNVTKPLLMKLGPNPTKEALDGVIKDFITATVSEIDKSVIEYNGPDYRVSSREEDESEAEPIDVIRGRMITDHDYLSLVAGKL